MRSGAQPKPAAARQRPGAHQVHLFQRGYCDPLPECQALVKYAKDQAVVNSPKHQAFVKYAEDQAVAIPALVNLYRRSGFCDPC